MINKQRCKEGFAPAIKNKKGQVFLPDRKDEIHSDIYMRLEPPLKRERAKFESGDGMDMYLRRMERKKYIEGFVILKTGEFLDRDEMEKYYGDCETYGLRSKYKRGLRKVRQEGAL